MRWLLVLACAVACDRGHREKQAPKAATPVATQQAAGPCTLEATPLRIDGSKRLVAIGDLHGDLAATKSALRAGKLIDSADHWIGGDTFAVQTGDVLDRGDDEPQIIELLERLDGEARKAGGALIMLLGNHELMNAAFDFRYVTPEGMTDFGDRRGALGPGGAWAKRLAQHDVVKIVDGNVLSHAGPLIEYVDKLDAVNLSARCWLAGQGPEPEVLSDDNSPVWQRDYGIAGEENCAALERVLAKLGAKRMIVGHTVQDKNRGITSACDDKLWRIDVGLAKLYDGPIQVLEITDVPRVLTGTR